MRFAKHRATDRDVTFLVDVFVGAMRVHIAAARGSWDESRERRQFLQQLQVQHTELIRCDGADVGFLTVIDRGQDVELHTLCIAPEYQGQGLGTGVTRQLLDECHGRGRGVVLSVLKANTRARALYDRVGFVVTEETLDHYRMRAAPARPIPTP
jgi:ribosomal protein S18 acetylase RimI-like enzyme